MKTQSFSTLRAAGCPSIQAFTFSKLSKDPESDAIVFDNYQEEQAMALDAAAGIPAGGGSSGSNATFSETPVAEQGRGHPNDSIGICPVCGSSFRKRSNNQVYDKAECREQARGEKNGKRDG